MISSVFSLFIPFLKFGIFIGVVWLHIAFGFKPYIATYLIITDLIKRIRYNIKNKNDRKFDKYGFHLYCGLGGSGKTLSIVNQLREYREKYPKLCIATNFNCELADKKIEKWQDLIEIENPYGQEYGVVFAFDEIHLTLNSQSFKSRPDSLLEYISQQRKLRKQILASSQVFTRVDKILREQTNLVIECSNIFGRWVFLKAFDTEEYLINAELKDNGIKKRRRRWRKNFIATNKIFSLYDTHEVMKPLLKEKTEEELRQETLTRKAINILTQK